MDWTTSLINGEQEDLDINAKLQHTISSATSNCDTVDETSGGNKCSPEWDTTTGEPKARTIHGTDISVLYQNVEHLEEDAFQRLPKVTKQWSRNNPDDPCPDHSQDSSRSKKKKSNRQVAFVVTDDESYVGEDDNCSESSDGDSDLSNH